MKYILFALSLFLAAPAFAGQSAPMQAQANVLENQICLLDRTTTEDGKSYNSCAVPEENDALLNAGFFAARISRLQLNTTQPIWVHGVCRYIDNKAGDVDYFIPFKTDAEWQSYLMHMPSQMTATNCCVPRKLTPADIVTPPMVCVAGWYLKDIRKADGTVIMRPAGSGFMGTDGKPVELPLMRDDENAVFNYNGQTEMLARFVCGGGPKPKDPSDVGVLVAPHPDDDLTPMGQPSVSPPGEIVDMGFSGRCNKGEWTTYSSRPCIASSHSYTVNCQNFGGGEGEVVIMKSVTCPGGEHREAVVSNSCQKPSETPPSDVPPDVKDPAP